MLPETNGDVIYEEGVLLLWSCIGVDEARNELFFCNKLLKRIERIGLRTEDPAEDEVRWRTTFTPQVQIEDGRLEGRCEFVRKRVRKPQDGSKTAILEIFPVGHTGTPVYRDCFCRGKRDIEL